MPLRQVLLVGDFAAINGGQAKVAIDSARLLADAGLKVHFAAATGEPDPLLDHPGITVEVLGQHDILADPNRMRASLRGIWNRPARKWLDGIVARFDPAETVLHCHGYAKALSPSIGPVLTDGPLPAVYTMHEYFLACPNGGFYDFQRHEICHRRALGSDCLSTNCDVRHAAHKAWRVARQAATWGPGGIPRGLRDVIYISETQRRAMAPYLDAATRLHHVPNPIDVSGLDPVRAADNDIFLFVGRLNPEKGAADFARAAAIMGVPAVFVGDGVEADAVRAANPDAVITGWQTPAQVQEWIGKARALVFPSLWYEGQPLVPMEAICRGVPVVTNDWTAAADFVAEGTTGTIYRERSDAALVAAMEAVLDLPPFDPAPWREACAPHRHGERLVETYHAMMAR